MVLNIALSVYTYVVPAGWLLAHPSGTSIWKCPAAVGGWIHATWSGRSPGGLLSTGAGFWPDGRTDIVPPGVPDPAVEGFDDPPHAARAIESPATTGTSLRTWRIRKGHTA